MSLHIELRRKDGLSTFVPRTSTIFPLSEDACHLLANDVCVVVYGVSAAQMHDAINGGLFVVDCLNVAAGPVSIVYDTAICRRHVIEAKAEVARAKAAASGVPNPVLNALARIVQQHRR